MYILSACSHGGNPNGTTLTTKQMKTCKSLPSSVVNQPRAKVLMLSLNAYCRHKAIIKRIEGLGKEWLSKPGSTQMLSALGAFIGDSPRTRVVFCRETFDYPQLFEHEMICEELGRRKFI